MSHPVPPRRRAPKLSPRRAATARAFAPVWAALLLAFACASAAAKPNFTVQPPPAWVLPAATPQTTDSNAADAESGVRYLVDDRQERVTSKGTQDYYHVVELLKTAAAVEQVSQLQLDFEPSFQSLVIHHIRILRGGQAINVLRPSEIQIIQQEKELDQRLFNGTLSAVVVLNDVRPGDVIDYDWSVNGDNPVLAGNFADTFTLAEQDPVDYLRFRLLWPSSRKLFLRPRQTDLQPAVNRTGGETEYAWERRDVPAVEAEDSAPSWFEPTPNVQLSEFETWGDVARWAAPLYEAKALSPALKSQIAAWQKLPTPEARLLAARRFVQDEVRYLGIEMGSYSHQPTQPSKVFERRFGDCKDKALLLATILNALGIEARPALVNTDARRTLDDWQPSPYAFDHCIVEAVLDGKTYWIDATASYQRGTLASYYPPEYERALVLRSDTQALTEIPPPSTDAPTTTVRDTYEVKSFDAPVKFNVTTVFRGADADQMRYHIAGESRSDMAKEYLNYYADRDPSISADAPPEISDDEEANVITITERYTIRHFWKNSAHEFLAQVVGDHLDKPNISQRSTPLQVSFPTNVEQTVEIRLPEARDVATGDETVEDEAMRFTASATTENNVVRLRYTLRTKQDSVAASQVENHLALVDKARDLSSYDVRLGQSAAPAAFGSPPRAPKVSGAALNLLLLLALGGVALLVFYGWLKQRRSKRRATVLAYKRSLPGGLPQTAIRLREETDIKRYIAAVSCHACGRHGCDESARQGLLYDDQRLVVVHLVCERCRSDQDFYFAVAV
jgi:transglutaminase-like putative cysteine protease